MSIINIILDFIFPVDCISCGKRGEYLCIVCLAQIQEAQRESLSWVFPLFDYRDPLIKKALHLLKYKHKKPIANIFGSVLYNRIIEELSELSLLENFTQPLLIPIPLAPKRKTERGFNQSLLICKYLMQIDKTNRQNSFELRYDILIKPKDTTHQAHIHNRTERLKNLLGSFNINIKNQTLVKNRNIILIDDITTTGATLSEAKKTLKKYGAKKIIAFTIAH
ncbi:MAG: hypothetical protein M3P22_00270 [bacterium]|nr:hypothetical protein [bacterium]